MNRKAVKPIYSRKKLGTFRVWTHGKNWMDEFFTMNELDKLRIKKKMVCAWHLVH